MRSTIGPAAAPCLDSVGDLASVGRFGPETGRWVARAAGVVGLAQHYGRAVTSTHSPGIVIPSAFVQARRFARAAANTSRWTLDVSSESE